MTAVDGLQQTRDGAHGVVANAAVGFSVRSRHRRERLRDGAVETYRACTAYLRQYTDAINTVTPQTDVQRRDVTQTSRQRNDGASRGGRADGAHHLDERRVAQRTLGFGMIFFRALHQSVEVRYKVRRERLSHVHRERRQELGDGFNDDQARFDVFVFVFVAFFVAFFAVVPVFDLTKRVAL